MVAMTRTFSKTPPKFARWRVWVQAAFLLVWLDPFMLRLHNVCAPVFHCYACPLATFACPIGVLANFSALHVIPLLAIGTLGVVGGIFGGFVCGWACPFGFLQDLIARIPVPKFHLPSWMGYTRYAVLVVLVLAIPFFYGEAHPLFFCRVCPAGTLEGGMYNVAAAAVKGADLPWPSLPKLIILGLIVAAMFVQWRPWCALFCPLGAIFGLFKRVSAIFLRVDPEECVSCSLCREECRYGIAPDKQISDPRCVACLQCTRCSAISIRTIFSRREAKPAPGTTPTASPPAQ
jgi:polyferredoxin